MLTLIDILNGRCKFLSNTQKYNASIGRGKDDQGTYAYTKTDQLQWIKKYMQHWGA